MNRAGLAQGVIGALAEPAFLLAADGLVIWANRAARAALGAAASSGSLADRLASPRADFDRLLGRARATRSAVPGALVFGTPHGERRMRVTCSRLTGPGEEIVFLLRFADPRDDRFALLTERVRQLDAELRQRAREKAVLGQALDENRNLMRELQHRVKNNIQMMISLLTMSAATSRSPEVRAFAAGAKDRFRALATTQDLIYEARTASAIPARDLFGRLGKALGDSANGAVTLDVDIADVRLPQESAHCLALIVNELVTNSIKHAFGGRPGRIRITLDGEAGTLRLAVADDGRGYPDLASLPRSSGLTLIRGLCRQIGGALELGNSGGARSVVVFAEGRAGEAAGGEDLAPAATPAST